MLVHVKLSSGKMLEAEAKPDESLAQAIWLSGLVPSVPLCAGLGTCGRCKARFVKAAPAPVEAERLFFSEAELEQGWRLLCRHKPCGISGETWLELPESDSMKFLARHVDGVKSGSVFLGVDLGTTSIQWQAHHKNAGLILEGALLNPQGGTGADIISRVKYATNPAGLKRLSNLAWQALFEIADVIQTDGYSIGRLCVAANSVMTAILLEKDITGFMAAPYRSSYQGGEIIRCEFSSLRGVELIIPPQPAPFIGGDISAGLLAVLKSGAQAPFLLADLGTNCELALFDASGRLFLTSIPLGPALEGIGPAMGMAAGRGAITSFLLSPSGLNGKILGDSLHPQGISATGYLSLISQLRKLEILDRAGHFQAETGIPLAAKISANICERQGQAALALGDNLYLFANDVELLLKIRAAFAVALKMILAAAKLEAGQLNTCFIAGSLGSHVDANDLERLGFIPASLRPKLVVSGNTSLSGASILANRPQELASLKQLCSTAIVVDLVNNMEFEREYIDAMQWS